MRSDCHEPIAGDLSALDAQLASQSPLSLVRRIQLAELRLLKELDKLCTAHDIRYWIDGGTLLGAVRHAGFIPWDDDIDVCMPRADFEKFVPLARSALPTDMGIEAASDQNDADYNVPCRVRDRRTRIVATPSAVHLQRGLFIDIIPVDAFHAGGPWRLLEIAAKFTYRNLIKLHQPVQERTWSARAINVARQVLVWTPGIHPEALARTFRRFIRKAMIDRPFNREERGDLGYGFDVRWTRLFKRSDVFPLGRIKFEDIEVFAPHNPEHILKVFYGSTFMRLPPPAQQKSCHFSEVVFDIDLETGAP